MTIYLTQERLVASIILINRWGRPVCTVVLVNELKKVVNLNESRARQKLEEQGRFFKIRDIILKKKKSAMQWSSEKKERL